MFSRRRQKAPSIPFRISSKYNTCWLQYLLITNIVKLQTLESNSLKSRTAASGWKYFGLSFRSNGCASSGRRLDSKSYTCADAAK
jgi:hypothetical protein